ncbi:MAG TPA: LytTR family DNA-binding domain-containing protein [Thermoanaerobaculia bacterium]
MIRALIADDEAPARAKVRKLLASADDVEVVGEAADGAEAVAAIRLLAPDVVFLDVRMPRLDGFGVVAEIGVEAMPLVVFVTAYDEHALKAFEVHALDYLLKPFAASRFGRVLERVRRQLAGAAPADLARRLELALAAVEPAPRYLRRLTARLDEDREVILPVERIDLIRAHGNYVRLHTADGEYVRRATLSALAGRLDPEHFLRVNRSEIVRLDAVAELQPWFHGDYRVIMKSGRTLTWSRRYRAKTKDDF